MEGAKWFILIVIMCFEGADIDSEVKMKIKISPNPFIFIERDNQMDSLWKWVISGWPTIPLFFINKNNTGSGQSICFVRHVHDKAIDKVEFRILIIF